MGIIELLIYLYRINPELFIGWSIVGAFLGLWVFWASYVIKFRIRELEVK